MATVMQYVLEMEMGRPGFSFACFLLFLFAVSVPLSTLWVACLAFTRLHVFCLYKKIYI